MGTVYDSLDDEMTAWLLRQAVFFVATAPTGPGGHVNVSPKGCKDTFFVLGPDRVAYVDLPGSGIETVAHLRENGRICLMFCAFDGAPKVVRLHGSGTVLPARDPRFVVAIAQLPVPVADRIVASARGLIDVRLDRIADSCGYTVPRMRFEEERDQLFTWIDGRRAKHGKDAILRYVDVNNTESIDGLAGLDPSGRADQGDVERLSSENRKL
jgi:hypothetical protein